MASASKAVKCLTRIRIRTDDEPLPAGTILTEDDLPKKELNRLIKDGYAEAVRDAGKRNSGQNNKNDSGKEGKGNDSGSDNDNDNNAGSEGEKGDTDDDNSGE